MKIRSSNNDDISDAERAFSNAAERVAERHGLNVDRVMAVYRRYLDFGRLVPPGIDIAQLDRAISVIGPSKALELFENEDLLKLADRAFLLEYFSHYSDILLCSLDELARLIEEFISYLLNNREDLIEDGHSRTCFLRSLFLDWQLAKLYHFNFPIATEAPSSEDRERLIMGRGKLFRLKIAVIEELLQAIRHQPPTNLWEKCLPLLTEALSADDAEFYLRMDRLYMGYDAVHKGPPVEIPNLDRPGGLTDLLEVIGHCEEELTVGAFSKTRNLLGVLVTFDALKRPILQLNNYFEAAQHPLKDVLDSALDLFSSFEPKVSDFWENYVNRVNQALRAEFYVEPINGVKVKRKIMLSYELLTTFLSGSIKPHFEATGKFPWNPPSYAQDTQMRDEFVFRKEKGGDFWTIIYEGRACPPLRDMKGFQYISLLLDHADEPFSSFLLDVALDQWPLLPPAEIYSRMTNEKLSEENLRFSSPSHAESRIDLYQYMASYNKMWKELLKEKHRAELHSDKAREERIQGELENLNREIGKIQDDWNIHLKRSRKAVRNCIRRSLDIIKHVDENLWRHLYDHIHTGMNCSYTPPTPIPWRI
jgi:hypothetical protein